MALALWPIIGLAEREITVCQDFGCRQQTTVTIATEFSRWLATRFEPGPDSAAGERQRIAEAIALLERQVGAVIGTDRDVGGNYDPDRDLPGQLDCVAESRNTTTYLRLLDDLGLLRWHRPVERRYRSRFLIDGHWTAVIEEIGSGRRYAVDSWYHDNGEPPEIQPLENWLRRERPQRR